jgi:Domain of unknown function (DUF4352)
MDDEGRGAGYGGPMAVVGAILVFLTVLLLTIIALGFGEDPATPTSAEPSSVLYPVPSAVPSIEPIVLASGQDEDLLFIVTNVERGIPATVDGERVARGAFTFVTLTVKNVGDEQLGFFRSDVAAIDSSGQRLVNDVQENFVETVDPGSEIATTIAFDVPDGAHLAALVATGSTLGTKETPDGVEIPLP